MARRFRDAVVRGWPTARLGLAHPATSGFTFLWVTGLHERWLERSSHAGEVISGYGASLVMLGVFVGARPYIRAGVEEMIRSALPRHPVGPLGGPSVNKAHADHVARVLPEITLNVWLERVVAVAIVLLGTFLNGYGTPLAQWWGLPV